MQKKKSITITDIAKKAGVSRTTISFFLNQKFEKMSAETRNKIEEVIKETEYSPNPLARSLNDKHSNLIGVMMQQLDSWDKEQFLEGVESYLNAHEYQMIVSFSNRDLDKERQQLKKMQSLNVDGYLVSPSDHFDLVWKALGSSSPLVVYNPGHVSPYKYWIKTNDYEAVYDTLEKAAEAGYARFVMVSEEPVEYSLITQRSKAFDDLCAVRHLPSDSLFVTPSWTDAKLDFDLVRQIRVDEPTCFFVTSPTLLKRVYRILHRYNSLMPQSIGLIGFNSLDWSDMVTPGVTTIAHPAYQAGQQTARLLLDVILDKKEELPSQILSCELHQEATTLPLTYRVVQNNPNETARQDGSIRKKHNKINP